MGMNTLSKAYLNRIYNIHHDFIIPYSFREERQPTGKSVSSMRHRSHDNIFDKAFHHGFKESTIRRYAAICFQVAYILYFIFNESTSHTGSFFTFRVIRNTTK